MTLSSTIAVHFAVTLEKRRIFNEHYPNTFKALAHYTRNCNKCSYLQYTLQFFFHNGNDFFNSFFMRNNFLTDFFVKIFAVSCVVCKGLYVTKFTNTVELYPYQRHHNVVIHIENHGH